MALAVHFQALLSWLNASSHDLPFRTTQILDCGTYGWMEFITASPCESPQEVERFYQRQGGYLALLYAIEATDFHLENLIAAGEHPVLIDLEAFFHPRVAEELMAWRTTRRSWPSFTRSPASGSCRSACWPVRGRNGVDLQWVSGAGPPANHPVSGPGLGESGHR